MTLQFLLDKNLLTGRSRGIYLINSARIIPPSHDFASFKEGVCVPKGVREESKRGSLNNPIRFLSFSIIEKYLLLWRCHHTKGELLWTVLFICYLYMILYKSSFFVFFKILDNKQTKTIKTTPDRSKKQNLFIFAFPGIF